MDATKKEKSRPALAVSAMVEDIVGCKWSMSVLGMVRAGVVRPGAMQRRMPGLSTKVLNERLRKLMRFGILEKIVYPEIPPRVEYRLTRFGKRFGGLLDEIERLQDEVDSKA